VSSGVSACSFVLGAAFAGMADWPGGSSFPVPLPVRASGRPGSGTGRSPAGVAGAGGVLDAGDREPIIVAGGEGGPAGLCVSGCVLPMAGCGRSPNSPGRRSSNSPGPGRVLILADARGVSRDDTPGPFAGPVAGPVHEDLVAGVDDPVEEGFGDDGVG